MGTIQYLLSVFYFSSNLSAEFVIRKPEILVGRFVESKQLRRSGNQAYQVQVPADGFLPYGAEIGGCRNELHARAVPPEHTKARGMRSAEVTSRTLFKPRSLNTGFRYLVCLKVFSDGDSVTIRWFSMPPCGGIRHFFRDG